VAAAKCAVVLGTVGYGHGPVRGWLGDGRLQVVIAFLIVVFRLCVGSTALRCIVFWFGFLWGRSTVDEVLQVWVFAGSR